MFRRRHLLAAVVANLSVSPALAIGADPSSPDTTAPLAVGDLVEVAVPGLMIPRRVETFDEHVGDDGCVPLPLVGEIPVAGQTLATAAETIDKHFADAHILKNAGAIITLVRHAPHKPIAAGERLRIRVWDLGGPGSIAAADATVAADGTVHCPELSDPISVAGLSEAQCMQKLTTSYAAAGLLANAALAVQQLDPPETQP